jgi:putative lipoprotein
VEVDLSRSDAIPPGAVLRVTLADTSKLDARAEEIGSLHVEHFGSLPARLSLRYDPDRVIDNHAYAVRATISVGNTLVYTTDTAHAVITRGAPSEADLQLVPVGNRREC